MKYQIKFSLPEKDEIIQAILALTLWPIIVSFLSCVLLIAMSGFITSICGIASFVFSGGGIDIELFKSIVDFFERPFVGIAFFGWYIFAFIAFFVEVKKVVDKE